MQYLTHNNQTESGRDYKRARVFQKSFCPPNNKGIAFSPANWPRSISPLIALSVWLENTGPRFMLCTSEMLPFKCLESLELFSSGPQFQAGAKPRVALEDCV